MVNNSIVEKLLQFFKDNGISILEAVQALSNKEALMEALNYREIEEQPSYTFKEAVAWIKEHFDPKLHAGATITKKVAQDGTITLSCCLTNKENEPLTRAGDPFLQVRTKEICQDLKDNFGDKDMIIIQ